MSSSMVDRKVVLAGGWGAHGGALLHLSSALQEALGQQPRLVPLPASAGPNELIQVLLDGVTWSLVAKGVVGAFGTAYLTKLGGHLADGTVDAIKRAWRSTKPEEELEPPQARRLVGQILEATKWAQRGGNDVALGMELSSYNLGIRLARIEGMTSSQSYDVVVTAIAAMASTAPIIEDWIASEVARGGRSAGYSGIVQLDENGKLVVFLQPPSGKAITFESDGTGKIAPQEQADPSAREGEGP